MYEWHSSTVWKTEVKYGASTEIVQVKYDASTKFLGESPKMETYFVVIIVIIIMINLQNCVKSCQKICGGKKNNMGKPRHRMEDVKMHLEVAWRLDSTAMPL